MLAIDGKNKDTNKARKDLEDKGIRKDLWLTQCPDGSYVKPCASFVLTLKEREAFFEFLKSVKYPDGYATNISRSMNSINGRLTGLKSNDYHILIQQTLPIGMRGFVDKEISITLFELGSFFQDLCSKTLRRSESEKLEERRVLILCKFEKIFPPTFFDVMAHLAVHIPREAILGGPFVSNRARPEGSIAEAYIVKECITSCLMYLDEVNRVRANKSTEATDELRSLAIAPNLVVKEHYGCITNALRFHMREVDDHRKSQNSGVLAHGNHEGKMHNYYGHLIKVEMALYELINTAQALMSRTRSCQSDPFILPRQAKQVFNLNDTKWDEPWQVVQLVEQKGVFDVPEFRREDAEVEVIVGARPLHETIENLIDDEVDEEHEIIGEDINDEASEDHEISDADMDLDMDYDGTSVQLITGSMVGLIKWTTLTIYYQMMRMVMAINSESNDSFEQEDIETPPGGLLAQLHTEPQYGATLISERVTRSTPHPSIESQASLPPISQPQNGVLPENNGGE
ncbi:hypothetical protein RHSIM_Rhsim01G0155300 [Rhododendron simsii]|uniref:DUF4218 domain-containing protein n=1 Tax=Rhododendron simsii TaxID=118357 RepID=A0A834HEK9_RHOSS|nr:hypothetical protein RHSIM_Rhsim01G0155300 [Rhododendron simsii]